MRKDKSKLIAKIIACDICGKSMRDDILFKHNAAPIIEGWCCEKCNDEIVVPTRFAQLKETKLTKEVKYDK
jgi:hypothetical protein